MTNKEFFHHVHGICKHIRYKPEWSLLVRLDGKGVFLQCEVIGLDAHTHKPTTWVSGKRYLSVYACKQEIVGAVFALIKDAEMHEVHEWFKYKDRSIYNPHLDPDVLASVAVDSNMCARHDSMTRT